MCDACREYLQVAEEGRKIANERDRLIVQALDAGQEPMFLEIPEAPQRPRCKDESPQRYGP